MNIYDFKVADINGKPKGLAEYAGKVMLIVNVASKCGLTPQYEGLEKLYERYHDQGFEVLGFPANEFLGQEPGTNEEIQQFCQMNFGVKFPLFQKIVVKGEGQHPLYHYLTTTQKEARSKEGGQLLQKLKEKNLLSGEPHDIKWNFEKFLIGKKGEIVARFTPDVDPQDETLVTMLESELKK